MVGIRLLVVIFSGKLLADLQRGKLEEIVANDESVSIQQLTDPTKINPKDVRSVLTVVASFGDTNNLHNCSGVSLLIWL